MCGSTRTRSTDAELHEAIDRLLADGAAKSRAESVAAAIRARSGTVLAADRLEQV